MGVKGSNSTLNTTDTSGATALHPARDGATREKQDFSGLGADEKGVSGVRYPDAAGQPGFDGAHSAQGFAGGPGNSSSGYNTTTGGTYSGDTGDSFADGGAGLTGSSSTKTPDISSGSGRTDTTSYSSGASRSDQETAPNYAGTVSGAIHSDGQYKPKGSNLTEGDIPATKTFTGNVGGQYDPGRLAEQNFQKTDADDTVSAGQPKYSGSGQDSSTGGQYDVLSSERAPDRSY